MKNNWKSYLSFTKKERIGIIALLVLITVVTAIPYCWPGIQPRPDHEGLEKIQQAVTRLEAASADSLQNRFYPPRKERYLPQKQATKNSLPLFTFDPNTLSVDGWKALGVRARTVETIRQYVAKGGKFRQPADLKKIYGLQPAEAERLIPYVQIAAIASFHQPVVYPKQAYAGKEKTPAMIDINMADTSTWIRLPGIGSKLALRIVNFRQKLGGFYSVDQVSEVYALPDSVFQRIRPSLQCPAPAVQQLNINTADVQVLRQHPYLRWPVANAIVQYRQQHGSYQKPEDLLQVAVITPDIFRKIAPYVTIE